MERYYYFTQTWPLFQNRREYTFAFSETGNFGTNLNFGLMQFKVLQGEIKSNLLNNTAFLHKTPI